MNTVEIYIDNSGSSNKYYLCVEFDGKYYAQYGSNRDKPTFANKEYTHSQLNKKRDEKLQKGYVKSSPSQLAPGVLDHLTKYFSENLLKKVVWWQQDPKTVILSYADANSNTNTNRNPQDRASSEKKPSVTAEIFSMRI